jgi:hypothetical protein
MDLFATAILVLTGIAIGFLLSALVSSLRNKPAESTQEKINLADRVPEDAVRLWRDPHTQQIWVEMGGRIFHSPGELDKALRERLARLAGDLERWSGGLEDPVKPVGSPPTKMISQTMPSSTSTPPMQQTSTNPVQAGLEGPDPNPFKIFSQAFQPVPKSAGETGPESIVTQIDARLQASLEGTHLAARGVRLVETPGEGISVQVGPESYPTIEDVPDPEVRQAIRQAVADWEAGLA